MQAESGWGQTVSAYKEIAQQQARGFRDDVAKRLQRISIPDDSQADPSRIQSGVTLRPFPHFLAYTAVPTDND